MVSTSCITKTKDTNSIAAMTTSMSVFGNTVVITTSPKVLAIRPVDVPQYNKNGITKGMLKMTPILL
ncbi:hypothetical protein D3C71_2154600 [compost metagenome]